MCLVTFQVQHKVWHTVVHISLAVNNSPALQCIKLGNFPKICEIDFLSIQWLLSWLLHRWRGRLSVTNLSLEKYYVWAYLFFFPTVFFMGNAIITSKQVQPPSFFSVSHYKLGNLPLTTCTWTWSCATGENVLMFQFGVCTHHLTDVYCFL